MKKRRFLAAVIALGVYFTVSNIVFVASVPAPALSAYGAPMLFGMATSLIFLYLFEHEGVFAFARELERLEESREKKFIKRFSKRSRVFSTTIIGIIGGPVFSALSAHLLIPRYRHRYVLLILVSIPSTIAWMGAARGLFSFVFKAIGLE